MRPKKPPVPELKRVKLSISLNLLDCTHIRFRENITAHFRAICTCNTLQGRSGKKVVFKISHKRLPFAQRQLVVFAVAHN